MATIRPNRAGRQKILQSREMRAAVEKLAEQIAGNIRAQGRHVGATSGGGTVPLPVEVSVYETDRARATVWLAHPAGLAVQAKHGALTKAASDAGLEVKGG